MALLVEPMLTALTLNTAEVVRVNILITAPANCFREMLLDGAIVLLDGAIVLLERGFFFFGGPPLPWVPITQGS